MQIDDQLHALASHSHEVGRDAPPDWLGVVRTARSRQRRRRLVLSGSAAAGVALVAGAVALGPSLLGSDPERAPVADTTESTAGRTLTVPTHNVAGVLADTPPAWWKNGTAVLEVSGTGCVALTVTGSGTHAGTTFNAILPRGTTAAQDEDGYLLRLPTAGATDGETTTFRDGQQVEVNGAVGTAVDPVTLEALKDAVDDPCPQPPQGASDLFVGTLTSTP